VEHRLEFVTKVRGVSYYNDSIATNPDSVVAALNAFTAPVVLIAGGRDKNLPMDEMARLISGKVHDVVLVGEAADKIQAVIEVQPLVPGIVRCRSLEDAVGRAAKLARPGDVVLFSPACASFDMFRNFRERGEMFKKAVSGLR
jgi:UDP-N-acetylmuramoylalanine--D-glutamate ligase